MFIYCKYVTYYPVKRLLNTQRGAKVPSLLRHSGQHLQNLICPPASFPAVAYNTNGQIRFCRYGQVPNLK